MEALRQFRLKELACPQLMNAVRCGLASVIPVQLLNILTAEDLSLRVCGLPMIDLDYLKVSSRALCLLSIYQQNGMICRDTPCTKLG